MQVELKLYIWIDLCQIKLHKSMQRNEPLLIIKKIDLSITCCAILSLTYDMVLPYVLSAFCLNLVLVWVSLTTSELGSSFFDLRFLSYLSYIHTTRQKSLNIWEHKSNPSTLYIYIYARFCNWKAKPALRQSWRIYISALWNALFVLGVSIHGVAQRINRYINSDMIS